MIKLLKQAQLWDKDIRESVKKIYETCITCKQFSNTPPRPVVSLLPAANPAQIIAVDLKDKTVGVFKFIFYGIDVFTRLMFGVFLKSKKTEEVVRAFMVRYVQSGGMIPNKLWSDAGGEFNSDMMKELCEALGIEPYTGPGYTPTSNALVERHHAVVDRIFEKLMEESPNMDPPVALGWAVHSHNTYPGQHGWSPFQLTYGRNNDCLGCIMISCQL